MVFSRVVLVLLLVAACSTPDGLLPTDVEAVVDVSEPGIEAPGADIEGPEADIEAPPTCDDSKPPILMAHGFLAAGDTWALHTQRFSSRGWCESRIRAFDWDSLAGAAGALDALDAAVDALLAETGAQKLVLMGHSAGGGLGYDYLATQAHAAKVSHYVHIGSGQKAEVAASGVAMLNLWSHADLVIETKGDINGATNVALTDADHYSVATSAESFQAIYEFLEGEEAPADIVAQAQPVLSGKAVTFGENKPVAGGTVSVYPVDPATGARQGDPVATFEVAADGSWGPLTVSPDGYYEFFVTSVEEGDRPIHYYFRPFQRSNPLVYLRTLPGPSSVAGVLLGAIPFTDDNAVVVVFAGSAAVIAGRDALTVQGLELATDALASPAQTLLALFLYDDNANQKTDGGKLELFDGFPFLNAVDMFIEAKPGNTITTEFNGQPLNAAAWPAESTGAVVLVLN